LKEKEGAFRLLALPDVTGFLIFINLLVSDRYKKVNIQLTGFFSIRTRSAAMNFGVAIVRTKLLAQY
jgi:hypothetical protein